MSNSFVTPWAPACQVTLTMGFPRNGLSFSSPKDLSDSGTEPVSPSVTGGFFTAEPPEKPVQSSPLSNSRTLLSPQKEISYSLSTDSPSVSAQPLTILSLWICLFWTFNIHGKIINYVVIWV